jgi:ABC-type glutathione transport system ATPase component
LSISDQVCVMHDGVVQQVGTPWDIYNRPSNRFVALLSAPTTSCSAGARRGRACSLLGQALACPGSCWPSGSGGLCGRGAAREGAVNQPLPDGFGLVHLQGGDQRQAMFTGRELQLSVEVAGHGLLDALVKPAKP